MWLVYEQVAIAALDTRAMELAISLIQKIRKKFPSSSRTYRLTVIACTSILAWIPAAVQQLGTCASSGVPECIFAAVTVP